MFILLRCIGDVGQPTCIRILSLLNFSLSSELSSRRDDWGPWQSLISCRRHTCAHANHVVCFRRKTIFFGLYYTGHSLQNHCMFPECILTISAKSISFKSINFSSYFANKQTNAGVVPYCAPQPWNAHPLTFTRKVFTVKLTWPNSLL